MLEAHPSEKSIIVNYKLEAAVYGDGDIMDPMLADKKVCVKINLDKPRLIHHTYLENSMS